MPRLLLALITVIGSLAVTPLTYAQDAIKLKIADYMASSHYLTEKALKPWMQEITAATKGKVTFEHYPSQQLGKATDSIRLAQTGVAQIASITPSMAGDKLELSGVAELPGLFESSCQGTMAYMKAVRTAPLANEFKANGIHLLYAVVFRELQLFSRGHPIDSLAGVKGQKIMVPMRPTEVMLNTEGAVAQRLSSGAEAYQALQRGTVDSIIMNPESIYIYDMVSLTKFATENGRFGQLLTLYGINEKIWSSLDADTRSAIDAASERAARRGCEAVDDGFASVFKRFRQDGVKVKVFDARELQNFKRATDETAKQWVEGVNRHNKKGADALAVIRSFLVGAK